MELLGQLIWELVEVIWQMMATNQIFAVLLIVGVVIELLIGKRIKDRRPTHWKPPDAQSGDY